VSGYSTCSPGWVLGSGGVTSGSRVLDVAAGAGGQSVPAARRTGPRGRVLATDISAGILALAQRRFDQASGCRRNSVTIGLVPITDGPARQVDREPQAAAPAS
jgi:cyclopropane fatty-acyl-phospholipid synthase-like methyltransferase